MKCRGTRRGGSASISGQPISQFIDSVNFQDTCNCRDAKNQEFQFVRSGTRRGWKKFFSKEQSDQMDRKYKEEMNGTIFEHWWQEEMAW